VPQKSRTTRRETFERKIAARADIMRRIAPVLVHRITTDLADIRERIAGLSVQAGHAEARILGELWLEEASLIERLERLGVHQRPVN
jgi:hypothetical protein